MRDRLTEERRSQGKGWRKDHTTEVNMENKPISAGNRGHCIYAFGNEGGVRVPRVRTEQNSKQNTQQREEGKIGKREENKRTN
jgi:hypothetical protein